ncbi:hypothetical protein [Geothrix sp. PMB-07]|uniref:hypothetical protein n=1 Tax=Geothrix sp. PMB-07 TaxID=3068640 RepID=UPI0027421914|nr:hypothetical protein [Geothrix sp. PMB-07]WLT33344.1 hypothetical protein Q9293_08395 [Geothrix sp. PMB-07]
MAIESEHSRFQEERGETRFEMVLSESKKVLESVNQSRLRLEQFFSFFGEFEKRMYARFDDKVMPKLEEFDPLISDIFVRLMALTRTAHKRAEVEAEIQQILQGK